MRKFVAVLATCFLASSSLAGSIPPDVSNKTEKIAYYKLLENYLKTLEELKELKRQLRLLRKKEKFSSFVEERKKETAEDMLLHTPPPKLNVQGIVGNYVIVDNYAVPSDTATPYGKLRVKGVSVMLNRKLVFPYIQADYKEMTSIFNQLPKYYTTLQPPAGSNLSGTITIAPPER